MNEPRSEPVALRFEPSPKRVRVVFAGETVADSTGVHLLYEGGRPPVYYFPRDELRMELTEASDRRTTCPHKGEASYFSIMSKSTTYENAAWSYEDPKADVAQIKDHIAFYVQDGVAVEML